MHNEDDYFQNCENCSTLESKIDSITTDYRNASEEADDLRDDLKRLQSDKEDLEYDLDELKQRVALLIDFEEKYLEYKAALEFLMESMDIEL